MTDRLFAFGVWTLCVALAVATGCSRRPSRVHPPGIDAEAAGKAAMDQYDKNNDGKVAGDELANAPSLNAAIENLDTNGDKAVTAEEVTERIEKWQATKLGRMTITATVKYRGRPLSGAKVVFEPEEFLGTEIKAATGTTDQYGMASMSIPGSDIPGVAAGLYEVKITKEGANLPAKYNEQTILGTEVANDAEHAMEGGPTFELR